MAIKHEFARELVTTYPAKGCWYETYITECVLCGRTYTVKERRAGTKPDNPYHYEQDACSKHFF